MQRQDKIILLEPDLQDSSEIVAQDFQSALFIPPSIPTGSSPLQIQFIVWNLDMLQLLFSFKFWKLDKSLGASSHLQYPLLGWWVGQVTHPSWGTQLPEYVWYAYH